MTQPGATPPPPAQPSSTRTLVVGQLGEHAAEWDDLVASQPLPSPFLRSWWLDHVAGGRPAIVLVLADDRLVGGAAFELDEVGAGPVRLERVRMLGQGPLAPDHLDLVAAPGFHPVVARRVVGWLRRRGGRVIDLDGLAAQGTLAAAFAPHEVERVGAPWASLASGADDYLAARPGKVRSTVSRSTKRFDRGGAFTRTVGAGDAEIATAALEALARLHDERWTTESSFLSGWARLQTAAAAGIARGDVVVHELVAPDGDVVASELDLVVGDRVGFYQSGRRTDRDWRGCGSVVRAHAVRHAADSGAVEYDLLRGDEPYKAEWATGRREVVRVRAPHGLLARLALRWAARNRPARSPDLSPGPSPAAP